MCHFVESKDLPKLIIHIFFKIMLKSVVPTSSTNSMKCLVVYLATEYIHDGFCLCVSGGV